MKNITPGIQPRNFIGFILMLTGGIYIIENLFILWFKNESLFQYLGLSPTMIEAGGVWTLITYALLHDPVTHGGIWHILFNGLLIFFIGKPLENEIGSKNCAILYTTSAIWGGLAWLLCHWTNAGVLIGASAAAMGLLTVFCLKHAEEYITLLLFFIFPITIKPKWLLLLTIGYETISLLTTEIYNLTGTYSVANSAHLGGILGGVIFYGLTHKINFSTHFLSRFFQKKSPYTPPTKSNKFTINLQNKHHLKTEVDRILDKINQNGFGSLTTEEKSTLDKARDIL